MSFVQTQSLPYCGCGHPMRWHRSTAVVERVADDCLAVRCRCRRYDPTAARRPALKSVKASAA